MQSVPTCIPLESLPNTYGNFLVKVMFTLTVSEILLFEGRSVLPSAQWGAGRGAQGTNGLNVGKAHGHDNSSIRMLKICDSATVFSILFPFMKRF